MTIFHILIFTLNWLISGISSKNWDFHMIFLYECSRISKSTKDQIIIWLLIILKASSEDVSTTLNEIKTERRLTNYDIYKTNWLYFKYIQCRFCILSLLKNNASSLVDWFWVHRNKIESKNEIAILLLRSWLDCLILFFIFFFINMTTARIWLSFIGISFSNPFICEFNRYRNIIF